MDSASNVKNMYLYFLLFAFQVVEKKKYNDENCKKLQILSGDEWYTMQAYRALNQALGR